MSRDATVVPQADRNRQRDQLSGLGVEKASLFTGTGEFCIALGCVGTELGDPADAGDDLLTIRVPIHHVHDNDFGLFQDVQKLERVGVRPNQKKLPRRGAALIRWAGWREASIDGSSLFDGFA